MLSCYCFSQWTHHFLPTIYSLTLNYSVMTLALLIFLIPFYSHIPSQSKFHSSALLLYFPIFVQPSLKTQQKNKQELNRGNWMKKCFCHALNPVKTRGTSNIKLSTFYNFFCLICRPSKFCEFSIKLSKL